MTLEEFPRWPFGPAVLLNRKHLVTEHSGNSFALAAFLVSKNDMLISHSRNRYLMFFTGQYD